MFNGDMPCLSKTPLSGPDVAFQADEDVIPTIIQEHAEDAEDLKLRIATTMRDRKVICVFITHYADDPYGTKTCFTPFPLDAFAVELGRKLFLTKEDLDKAEFVTIVDPFDRGY
ncbi:hypothetical protein C0992_011472 [Termitomyces sp. T32_za158]|nr:hypothetical protein C0992_011472 [Termitomyces sp. T32_za158]